MMDETKLRGSCCRHSVSSCQQNRGNPNCFGCVSKVCLGLLLFCVRQYTCRKNRVPSGTRQEASDDGQDVPGSPNAGPSKFSVLSYTSYCNWSTSKSGTNLPAGQHCESNFEKQTKHFIRKILRLNIQNAKYYLARLEEHEALHGNFAASVNDSLHFSYHVTFDQLNQTGQTQPISQLD